MHLTKLNLLFVALSFVAFSLNGCDGSSDASECTTTVEPSDNDYETLQQAFIDAQAGDTVCLAAGTYDVTSELSVATRDITIRGAETDDREAAIVDFSNQDTGASGFNVTGDGFTIENFWVKNTRGEGIRVSGSDGLVFRGMKISWDAGSSSQNGAYGTFPVTCENVLIEDNIISGAADAAIYVGQSNNIIVRNNLLEGNVNGINIENSSNVDVHGNVSTGNTAGLAIFNLPNLPVQDGKRIRVFDNTFNSNNHENFGDPGAIIGIVPSGTGLVILAADDIEIFDNEFGDDRSTGILIASYTSVPFPSDDPNHDPYVEGVYIHDNVFDENGYDPQGILGLVGQETLEDIVWDGAVRFLDNEDPRICIVDNGDATYRFANAPNGFDMQDTDISRHDCTLDPLPPIVLP